jgi:hypothetical protein
MSREWKESFRINNIKENGTIFSRPFVANVKILKISLRGISKDQRDSLQNRIDAEYSAMAERIDQIVDESERNILGMFKEALDQNPTRAEVLDAEGNVIGMTKAQGVSSRIDPL